MFQTPWEAWMRGRASDWADGLRKVALAASPSDAVAIASTLESLPGAGEFQLGQILHLLHPGWFAIVNAESKEFWSRLGFAVGGVANLERISAAYRDKLDEWEIDFSLVDVVATARLPNQ